MLERLKKSNRKNEAIIDPDRVYKPIICDQNSQDNYIHTSWKKNTNWLIMPTRSRVNRKNYQ